MRFFVWIRDDWTELYDAVCTPQKVQAVGFDGSSPHGNDCDEEGIWLANVIDEPEVLSVEFMTVTWKDRKAGFGGHNVCLLRYRDGFRYMDYFGPNFPLMTEKEIAKEIVSDYTGYGELLVWCVSSPRLVPRRAGLG